MPRTFKTIGLVILGLVVAAFVAWTIWNQISARSLEDALEEARSGGYPLSLEALAGEPISDEVNAAVLYRESFAFMEAQPVNVGESGIFVEGEDVPGPPVVSATWRRLLPTYEAALDRLAHAGRMKQCQFRGGVEDPAIMSVLQAGALLAARVALCLEGDDLPAAEADLVAIRDLGRAVGGKYLLLSEMVEMSVREILADWVRWTLLRHPEPLVLWRRLGLRRHHEHLREGLRGEVAFSMDMVEGSSRELEVLAEDHWVWRHRWVTRPYLNEFMARYVRLMLRVGEAARSPYPEAISRLESLVEEVRFESRESQLAWLGVVGSLDILRQEARMSSRITATAIGARLLDHRRLHGSWPAALSDLAGDPVPLDPLTEKPFQLTREDGGLLLSSRDPDGGRWLLPE